MNKSVDLSKGVFEFPCEYGIKIMAFANCGFEERSKQIVEQILADGRHVDYAYKNSSKGKYLSISCTFVADSRVQLDQIYMAMKADDQVVMVL